MIPLFESVSAGFGALAVDEIVDYIPAYIPDASEAAETICIKVHGDSMFPKIEDGDVIQVHKQESVDSGSIAVVLMDGEDGLVKKVIYGDTWIELHSVNPMYKTQRFNGRDVLRIRVVGLVQKIIKDV
jgi:repressor LexA